MITLLVVALLGVALYLAKALSDANAEKTALRDQVAALKRQLRRGRA